MSIPNKFGIPSDKYLLRKGLSIAGNASHVILNSTSVVASLDEYWFLEKWVTFGRQTLPKLTQVVGKTSKKNPISTIKKERFRCTSVENRVSGAEVNFWAANATEPCANLRVLLLGVSTYRI